MNLQPELELASELAQAAGAAVMAHFRAPRLQVDLKPYDEPVTLADREASALIVRGLRCSFPDDVVVSEEEPDDLRRLQAGLRTWYVDPIDGTRDFVAGRDGFAVMIGLAIEHRPALGVTWEPRTRRLFAAARSLGAWCTSNGERHSLHCSEIADPSRMRLVSSLATRPELIDRLKLAVGINNELRIGSVGVKTGLIALGERDLYVNASLRSASWDTCAPQAILELAGGRMTDLFGAELRYDRTDVRHHNGLLASNGAAHERIANAVARLPGFGK